MGRGMLGRALQFPKSYHTSLTCSSSMLLIMPSLHPDFASSNQEIHQIPIVLYGWRSWRPGVRASGPSLQRRANQWRTSSRQSPTYRAGRAAFYAYQGQSSLRIRNSHQRGASTQPRAHPRPSHRSLIANYTVPPFSTNQIMSTKPFTSTSHSDFVSIFNTALETYKHKTKKDLASHPLLSSFQSCDSPEAIIIVLREQIPALSQSQNGDDGLTKWVTPTVNVLYAFSAALGQGVGLVNTEMFSS